MSKIARETIRAFSLIYWLSLIFYKQVKKIAKNKF